MRILAMFLLLCGELSAARYFASEHRTNESVRLVFSDGEMVERGIDIELDVEVAGGAATIHHARFDHNFVQLRASGPASLEGDRLMAPLSVATTESIDLLSFSADKFGWGVPSLILDLKRRSEELLIKTRLTFQADVGQVVDGRRLEEVWVTINTFLEDVQLVPDAGDILLPGDADRDGEVGFSDFLQLSQRYGGRGTWGHGDFDGDFEVGFSDFLILAGNYSGRQAAVVVPEPGMHPVAVFVLGVLAGLMLSERRRG